MATSSLIWVIIMGLIVVGGIVFLVIHNRKPSGAAAPVKNTASAAPTVAPSAPKNTGSARRNYGATVSNDPTELTRRSRSDS